MSAQNHPKQPRLERHCLVTIGATARFTQLLTEVLEPPFLDMLTSNNFTQLTLQCGRDLGVIRASLQMLPPWAGLNVSAFDFVDDLVPEMVKCRAEADRRRDGVIISHAGTGCILDALRVNAPLIVVPNPTLKDNHQTELAEEVQNQGYAIWGRLGQLDYAVEQSELLNDENARTFKPHPVSGSGVADSASGTTDAASAPADLDIWSISGAMMSRYGTQAGDVGAGIGAGRPITELRREETAQMALD